MDTSIPAQDEPSTNDSKLLTIEANSRKYGLNTMLLLRLSDGKFAVFNRKFQLLAIVDHFGEAEKYLPDGPDSEPEIRVYKKPAKSGKLSSISLEDLGL